MEELREAAVAYYNNGTEEQKNLARQFFRAMDVDGNGRVSLREYTDFLGKTAGLASFHPEMFPTLDQNGDGQLDFTEVLTLYYVARTHTVCCDVCLHALSGLYFTCVTCFESKCGDDTFDLCVKCYKRQAYSHPHRLFLDSNVLLRAKRSNDPLPPPQSPQQPPPQSPQQQHDDEQPEEESEVGWSDALEAMDVALTVGGAAVVLCTIM
ncbi:PREDICTED: uncharacterized protein LOC104751443 isoform X2 [Camelina sativa]|uniref:Uncharacterized protein LOC104751441 isoform X2 n=1 Tax=Camelina sativa TaxID=90675 RepID=A0ABM0WIU4_CAMSA|nr:PREDICTED: uncharacterized protein LOC104751441 isoform X2 [Camelina sativa]XP_010471687.1 PREDICTED: uncharacterized protein LOC104751443 isoform X2 [Camelina sativa]